MKTVTVELLADTLSRKQAELAASREPSFNLDKASGLAARIVRRELRYRMTIPGMRRPDNLGFITSRLADGESLDVIARDLRLTEKQTQAVSRYLDASLAERESRELAAHCSIVGDVADTAFILWKAANYSQWGERVKKAHANGETAKPLTITKAVRYAHGDYWREMRGGKVVGHKRDKLETDGEKRLYTIASELAGRARRGVLDLPESLTDKQRAVAVMLASGSRAADVADSLKISRPTVSAYCRRIGEALRLADEQAASLAPRAYASPFGVTAFLVDESPNVATINRAHVAERLAFRDGPLYTCNPLAVRIRDNVAASRRIRVIVSRSRFPVSFRDIAVYRREPRTEAVGEYSRAALVATVSYGETFAATARKYGRELLPSYVADETAQAVAELERLASRERLAVSREPQAVAVKPQGSRAVSRCRRDNLGNWITETVADDSERRAVALATAFAAREAAKVKELELRNRERKA